MKLILLHGTGASPEHNWFRSVERTFTSPPYEWQVWVPQLPNTDQPSGTEWVKHVIANAPFELNERTVVVGHSAGAVAALMLAQTVKRPLGAAFAVGMPKDNEYLKWEANARLFDQPFNRDALRRGAGYLAFIHSDNDPYCPAEQTHEVCDALDAEWIMLPGQDHFSTSVDPRHTEFPELASIIDERVGL